ncbi:MAG: Transcriptional regulator, AraC family [Moraxellaceae bacterium]|jgi:AraC-like DNA-binding protein|nr:Transcriptional regulator, AraC family [Moraxellaceae bacterium]MDF3030642.1 Transcriptional regulator, AraC family [Moraxellaceae bacterium]
MSTHALHHPSIPVTYARHLVELCKRWHVAPEELMAETALARLDPATNDTRLSPLEFNLLVGRALRLTGEPALGYHFGLQTKLSAHGFLGYAVMTSATLAEAISLTEKFFSTRSGALNMRFFTEGGTAVVQIDSQVDIKAPFAFPFESLLIGLAHAGAYITGVSSIEAEIWIDFPEPPYYAAAAHLLPCPIRYGKPVNQLRFPAELLEQPLLLADATASQLAAEQCERELEALSSKPLVSRVRALLGEDMSAMPDLETVARRCCMSARSLKRKLAEQGVGFSELVAELRRDEAMLLLAEGRLSVEQIAERLGYRDPANFTRAFKAWTGRTPRQFREEQRASRSIP